MVILKDQSQIIFGYSKRSKSNYNYLKHLSAYFIENGKYEIKHNSKFGCIGLFCTEIRRKFKNYRIFVKFVYIL